MTDQEIVVELQRLRNEVESLKAVLATLTQSRRQTLVGEEEPGLTASPEYFPVGLTPIIYDPPPRPPDDVVFTGAQAVPLTGGQAVPPSRNVDAEG